jgi:hypothetical protein
MGTPRFGPRRALAFTLASIGALVLATPAIASTGDILADLAPAGATGGLAVAFDGAHLYYTDVTGAVLHSVAADGSGHAETPIVGAAGINALAYDGTRDAFWGVDGTGLSVFLITREGDAARYFTIVPARDLPGLCDRPTGCSPAVSSLAYDGSDDSLWYAPAGSERVYHFDTIGHALGFFDTNDVSGTFFPDCTSNGVGGIAAGRDSLYLAAAACARAFRFTKSDTGSATRLTSLASPGSGAADVECDDTSFGPDALWVRDAATGRIRAIEIQNGSCGGGGGVAMNNPHGEWFTGGGTSPEHPIPFGDIAVHHGFVLWCQREKPQRLHLSWTDLLGQHHTFQLVAVKEITCVDTAVVQQPPDASVDTTFGNGWGRLDGSSCTVTEDTPSSGCAFVQWSLTDGGEGQDTPPGCSLRAAEMDAVEYFVTGEGRFGPTMMIVSCLLDGNVQAHGTS